MQNGFPTMVRISERTSEIRTKLNGGSGRGGVKGQDERQRTAPLTPPRPPREAMCAFQLTGVVAVIHGALKVVVEPAEEKLDRATLYNRIGVVKRHLCRPKVFVFSFVGGFCFCCCFCSSLIDQGPLSESRGGSLGSTSHLFGHLTSDHDSLFRLPDYSGRQGAPISLTVIYCCTRVALELPCMRTSCA